MRLAGIAATIRATEQRLRALAADRATIQAAIRLFETEDGERPGAPSLGIQAGAFSRTVLDTLRRAETPLSARGIAEAMARERAGRALERQEIEMLVARVRNTLPRLSDKLDGELRDRTTFWRVRG